MTDERQPSEEADVCIIGGGIAGGMVAYSLAKRGHRVVILEAGPWMDSESRLARMERAIRPEYIEYQDVWADGIDPERDRFTKSVPPNIRCRLNESRLKAVGGTTLHWGAEVPRMHPTDFNMESRYGLAADWPLEYEDLRPYYVEAEAELGVAGGDDNPFVPREESTPMSAHPFTRTDELFSEACAALGIRTHSVPLAINTEVYDGRSQCVGFSTCDPVCPSGAKYTGDVHVRKAVEEGARVIDRAQVLTLDHDRDGTVVEAAEYVTPTGDRYVQTADQFVIACGAIETARLLLLSSSDQHPDGMANRSGAVGKYLFGTNGATVEGELDKPANREPIGFRSTMMSDEFYEQDDATPGSISLRFVNANPTSPVEALGGGPISDDILEPLTGDLWGDALLEQVPHANENRSVEVRAQHEMLPREENRVTLDTGKTDSFGKPVPHITFDIGSHTIETSKHGLDIVQDILLEMGADITHVQDPTAQSLGDHHKGTTRMGIDPDRSVIDATLRTHDLRNLWIASSSVFPSGGAANPTLTIAALALKAAEHIDEQL